MIGTLIMPVLIGIVVTIICYGFYVCGYHDAMKTAEDMLDQEFEKKFKDAGIVVKKDNRIIECNGMISDNCKKCIFGRQPVYNVIECFAPDFDGVPVFGVTKDENLT